MRVLAWGSAEVASCAFFWFMRLVLRRAWWWGVGLWLFLFEGYRGVGGGGWVTERGGRTAVRRLSCHHCHLKVAPRQIYLLSLSCVGRSKPVHPYNLRCS